MKQHAPKRVVIVGGGTSGWMTAGFLVRKKARHYPLSITLVESSDIGVIGVGEATIPTLRAMIADLGIEEDEFFAATNGGFKLGVRFQHWLHSPEDKPGDYYIHPFQRVADKDMFAAAHYLGLHPDAPSNAYGKYASPQILACEMRKAGRGINGEDTEIFNYAYHLDAVRFGRFLRSRFDGKGVDRVEAKVVDVRFHENGDIRAIVLEDGREIEGDLFIDCSGFQGLLINKHLKVPFTSFLDWLPCDKACAVQLPYRDGETFDPYTKATAQSAGWIWDVSLVTRRGVGHVYCSRHQSGEGAERELLAYLKDPENSMGLKFRHLDMRVGRHDRLWERNCVAIGLAGGFIEPLESTGIFLIEQGIRFLDDNWPMDGVSDGKREHYDRLMHRLYDETLFFVLMHYVTSQRKDTPFWREITRERPLPGDLGRMLELWRHKLPSIHDQRGLLGTVFGFESFVAVLAGMGYFRGLPANYAKDDPEPLQRYLDKRQADFAEFVAKLPSHDDYIAAAMKRGAESAAAAAAAGAGAAPAPAPAPSPMPA